MSKNASPRITTTAELRDVSFVFRNLLKTNTISAIEIMNQAAKLLPKHRAHLAASAQAINNRGFGFTASLGNLFEPSVMAIIKAGEESGKLFDVFDRIWRNAKTQIEIDKTLGKLKMPGIVIACSSVITFTMLLLLVPYIYNAQASSAPPDFQPVFVVRFSLWLNEVVMGNPTIFLALLVGFLASVTFAFTNPATLGWIKDKTVIGILRFKYIGVPFANLKFGIMAHYIEVIAEAGLDAEKRIDLVVGSLPAPLRPGLMAFRKDFLIRGIDYAARAEGKPTEDPRHSDVLWPQYVRLAFAQANDGDWGTPMREFGDVMLEDGKEAIQNRIGILQNGSLFFAAFLIVIPYIAIYSTMGQLMQMKLQSL